MKTLKPFILILFVLIGLSPASSAQSPFENDRSWVFHTGEGYTFVEYRDPDTQQLRRIKSRCTLSQFDPECLERVYRFDEREVMRYVDITSQIFESKRNEALAFSALSGGIFIVSGKTFAKVFVGGALTPVTIGAGVSAAISAVFVVLEAASVFEYQRKLEELKEFVAESLQYAHRCGRPRINFLAELERRGVSIYFDENRAQYVPASSFDEATQLRVELLEKIRVKSFEKRISRRDAFYKYFAQSCHQALFVDGFGDWQGGPIENSHWKEVPEDIRALAVEVSQVLNLESGAEISFKHVRSSDWKDKSFTQSLRKALLEFAAHLLFIDKWGTEAEKNQLNLFRRRYSSVTIERSGWGAGDYYETVHGQFDSQLILRLRWSLSRWSYKDQVKRALKAAISSTSP